MKKIVINKKVILGMLTLVACAGIIVVTSFFPFVFQPNAWKTKEFLSDELIIIAITISSLVSMMFIAQASNAANPNSELAKSKVEFKNSIELITNRSAFCQWVKRIMQPKDCDAIIKRVLNKNGIKDMTILDLEISEIKSLLESPQQIGDKYYSQLEKEQIKVILAIKKGYFNIHLVEPTYYLNYSNILSDLTISEKSTRENKKKTMILAFSIAWKIIFSVIIAMIFASFAKDTMSEGVSTSAAFMKLFARMFALISSAAMGYKVGSETNDIDADYIRMRVQVHTLFLEDKTFVPLTDEEIAKIEYEKIKEDYKRAHTSSL